MASRSVPQVTRAQASGTFVYYILEGWILLTSAHEVFRKRCRGLLMMITIEGF